MEPDDGQLVERVRQGDADAFGELMRRYRDAVYGIALSTLGDPTEAADLAQEVFVQAYRALPQLREPARFAAWLCRIARNLALNHREAIRRRPQAVSLEERSNVPAKAAGVADQAHADEQRAFVRQAMGKLPDAQRLTFTLYYINGYDERDLSAMLGVPQGTIKSRLNHARERLRKEVVKMAEHELKSGKPDAEFWRAANGAVEGRVVSEVTGEPIEGATVRLHTIQDSTTSGITATTGPDGAWKIEKLVPAAYFIRVKHPQFATESYGGSRPGGMSVGAVVRPGQVVSGIEVRMKPGSILRGQVVDAHGAPVAKAEVLAMRRHEMEPEKAPFGTSPNWMDDKTTANTGEDGRFEISSLPDGEYLLAAFAGPEDDWARLQPACYYPGTFATEEAERFQLSHAQPLAPLTLRVAERGPATLRVRVTDRETKAPVPNARVLITYTNAISNMFTGVADAQGIFETPFLSPGTFLVTAGAYELGYSRWSALLTVPPGQTLVEMEAPVPKGAMLSGRIVTQDGSPLPSLAGLHVFVLPIREQSHYNWSQGWGDNPRLRTMHLGEGAQWEILNLEADGTIIPVPITAGRVMLHLLCMHAAWRLVEVRVAGQEPAHCSTQNHTIQCEPGERVDMDLVLGMNLGVIAGRVLSATEHAPVGSAAVTLFAGGSNRYAGAAETDVAGNFIMHAVPAGEYGIGAKRMPSGVVTTAIEDRRAIKVDPGGVVHLDLLVV